MVPLFPVLRYCTTGLPTGQEGFTNRSEIFIEG
jgi:hypothetical protein